MLKIAMITFFTPVSLVYKLSFTNNGYYLNEKQFGFAYKAFALVSSEQGSQTLDSHGSICAIDEPFFPMAQEDTGKAGSITVVLLSSCKANTSESKGSHVLNGNYISSIFF